MSSLFIKLSVSPIISLGTLLSLFKEYVESKIFDNSSYAIKSVNNVIFFSIISVILFKCELIFWYSIYAKLLPASDNFFKLFIISSSSKSSEC